ncbi:MAG: 23S rRNA (uracil(1939)-C(5))-methyltransferase RlmD [Alkalispirochaeta sp.]
MKKELDGVEITRLDSRGRGRGTATAGDGTERPVIVTGAYPGDVVGVQVRRRKSGAYLGEIRALHTAGIPRRDPFCAHFADCGGCTIQDIDYAAQLELKHAMVAAALAEVELAELPELPPVLGSPRERQYRNKLEFSFGAQRWLSEVEIAEADTISDRRGLGFHVAGRFDRVLDLHECHLQPEPSESIRKFVREFAFRRGWSFYDARAHTGLLRVMMIRTSLTGEAMVIVMFGEDDPDAVNELMTAIEQQFPSIASLNYVVNTTRNDSFFPHEVHLWSGERWITEQSGPNSLRIRPKAFYQTNPEQAVRLYETALSLTEVRPTDRVFDLYSGIGSIALFMARRVGSVVAVESIPDAVRAARENADLNGIANVSFEEGEVETVLPEVVARHGAPNLVVLDPPRAGLHSGARRALREIVPERILYISCNPRTQATDIAELGDLYRVTALQPVDMFPQTRHVENIAVLQRR